MAGRIERLMNELNEKRGITFHQEQDALLLLTCARDKWPGVTLTRLYRVELPDDHSLTPHNSQLGVNSK